MKNLDKTALIEGLKELLRVGILAIISYIATEGVVNAFIHWLMGENLDPQMSIIISSALLTILKSLDKWLHEKDVKSILDFQWIK